MTNDLISIPEYSNNEIKYITEISIHINGCQRDCSSSPNIVYDCFPKSKRNARNKYIALFSKFIYRTQRINRKKAIHKYSKHYIDPLECLWTIVQKYPKLNHDKFIKEHSQREEIPKYDLDYAFDSFFIDIKYIVIREQIISYIEQTIGQSKELDMLKELFNTCNNKQISFQKYINDKAKHLMSLNYDNYIQSLNKETTLKSKITTTI